MRLTPGRFIVDTTQSPESFHYKIRGESDISVEY